MDYRDQYLASERAREFLSNTPMCEDSQEYVICPHCGAEYGDCWEWVKNQYPEEMKCEYCGNLFEYFVEYSATYYTKPIHRGEWWWG